MSAADLAAQYPLGSTVTVRGADLIVIAHDHTKAGAPCLVCVAADPRERPVEVTAADLLPRGPVVYVSGPMTGLPDLGHGALKAMTAALRAAGFAVVCPSETPPPVRRDGAKPTHADWMRASIRRLSDCDVMVRLDGWDRSKGCNGETDAAYKFGMRIYGQHGREPADTAAALALDTEWDQGRAP